jgi:hypothetical protein
LLHLLPFQLFDLKNGYQDLKSLIAIQLESKSWTRLGNTIRAIVSGEKRTQTKLRQNSQKNFISTSKSWI